MPKLQMVKIARIAVGVCIAAGLLYFLYANNVPPIIRTLIEIGAVVLVISMGKAGVFDKDPTFRQAAKFSGKSPIRDILWALACFVVAMVLAGAMGYGVRIRVIPDK